MEYPTRLDDRVFFVSPNRGFSNLAFLLEWEHKVSLNESLYRVCVLINNLENEV